MKLLNETNSHFDFSISKRQQQVLIFSVLLLLSASTIAGTGGAEFDDAWITLKEWTQGTLGRIIAGSIILVGIGMGVGRQSLTPFAIGAGGAMGLYNSPLIVESIMGAIVSEPTVVMITNGLI